MSKEGVGAALFGEFQVQVSNVASPKGQWGKVPVTYVVLPQIIDESQQEFVSNRLISDNVILAFEVFHWLNTGNKKKLGAHGNQIGYE